MLIDAHKLGMRFGRHWLFRNLSFNVHQGDRLAILGPNGSGKSTLIRIIANYLSPTEGSINYPATGENSDDLFYTQYSLAAPYLELFEDLSLEESVNWHFGLKKPLISVEDFITRGIFTKHRDKAVSQFSSGMKQRLKLLLAFYSDTPLLLLDEPTTNLDQQGKELFQELIKETKEDRAIILASNDPEEHYFCKKKIEIKTHEK
jgi:ABC-type multidrug transport system ATPase subunit